MAHEETTEEASEGPLLAELGAEFSAEERARYADEVAPQRDDVLTMHGSGDLRLYERLLRDDQVHSTFQQRRTAIIASPVKVDAGGDAPIDQEAADDLREQIGAVSFDRASYKMAAGLMYGYGIGELMLAVEGTRVRLHDILVRRSRRFRFGLDGDLIMVDPERVRMPDRKFWVFTAGADDDDNPYGQGLGHWLYWPVWFKRNAHRFWALWLEKYASPTPVARGSAQMSDQQERDLLDMLKAVTNGGRLVIPKGVDIELIESARQAGGSYEKFCDRMDAAISKIVLSQTMTTDDGSSLSQASIHYRVQQAVIGSDSDLLTESFTKGPARWLTEWNFPGAKVPIVSRDYEEAEDLKARAERDEVITRMGYMPTPEYISETYGDGFVRSGQAPERTEEAPPATPDLDREPASGATL